MDKLDKTTQAYDQLITALDQLDRAACIDWAQRILSQQSISLLALYDHILVPSLNRIASNQSAQEIPIWEEHVKSAIVRSIIELASPYVYAAVPSLSVSQEAPTAIVLCLEEEYHELGARIAADYMILCGFKVHFIGANTPKKEIFAALNTLSPALLVISVTNYYHLVKLQHLIDEIKADPSIRTRIAVGGYAVDNTPNVHSHIQPDYFVKSYSDFLSLKEAIL